MARLPSWLPAVAAAGLAVAAGWLYLDNRSLRDELARAQRSLPAASAEPAASAKRPARGPREPGGLAGLARALAGAKREPAEPGGEAKPEGKADGKRESPNERRSRRSAEVAALFGRDADESEADYRERMAPFVAGMLERPRQRAQDMRREAEAKAGVTAEQSAAIDNALVTTYNELIEYTDGAIADGQVSPYQRNVSGLLGYAGGLGGILSATETKIGAVLRPEQLRAMYDSGFEWGEYLGVSAPWEKLRPPPVDPSTQAQPR